MTIYPINANVTTLIVDIYQVTIAHSWQAFTLTVTNLNTGNSHNFGKFNAKKLARVYMFAGELYFNDVKGAKREANITVG